MNVPAMLVSLCLFLLMGFGVFVILYSVLRLLRNEQGGVPAGIKLPWVKIELKGPAWLILAFMGIAMLAAPLIAGALQKPTSVIPPPPSVKKVQRIPDPSYAAFRFVRDVSVLDLRTAASAPWYTHLPGWKQLDRRPRIRPANLTNYMVVRKVGISNDIHLTYATSGRIDLRCLTHSARYRRAEAKKGETWEVIADVSSVAVNEEFEIAVEATYWNAFSGTNGDDYTTYGHNQTDPEELTIIVLFGGDKPFKTIAATAFPPDGTAGESPQGQVQEWPSAGNQSYYWRTTSRRPEWYYRLSWTW
jgi:hypothetical protein